MDHEYKRLMVLDRYCQGHCLLCQSRHDYDTGEGRCHHIDYVAIDGYGTDIEALTAEIDRLDRVYWQLTVATANSNSALRLARLTDVDISKVYDEV